MLNEERYGESARAISISKMNFCVEFQPGPPNSFGQLGQSQPLPASFFCHCSRRSLETWLVRVRRLSSATSGGMFAVIQSRTSFWKASSAALKARCIDSSYPRAALKRAPRLRSGQCWA
jgi:hypothetical protein